jgi:hypothetical protein
MKTIPCPRCGALCEFKTIEGKPGRIEAACSCNGYLTFIETDLVVSTQPEEPDIDRDPGTDEKQQEA